MGDWRSAGFFWILAPIVGMFGLSDLTVRTVSAVFGLVSVLLVYLIARARFPRHIDAPMLLQDVPALAAILVLITPWHVHFSRIGLEQTLFLSLLLLGVWGFIKGGRWRYLGAAGLGLSVYVYHVGKLLSPLLFLGLWWIFRTSSSVQHFKWKARGTWFLPVVFFVVIVFPVFYDSLQGAGQSRFGSINIWNDPKTVEQIIYARNQLYFLPDWISRIFQNKGTSFGYNFFNNYLSSWSPSFLFISGDVHNPRHSLPGLGLFYWWMLPMLVVGLCRGWKLRRNNFIKFIWWWLAVGPIPSALTQGGGNHAIRLFGWLPALVFFILLGGLGITNWIYSAGIKNRWLVACSVILMASMLFYAERYFLHYPQSYYQQWQYGMKPAIGYARSVERNYDQIVVTRSFVHLPMLHWLFYNQYDPVKLHLQFRAGAARPELMPTEGIGKYRFMTIGRDDSYFPKNTLYIASPWDVQENWTKLTEVASPDPTSNNPVLMILESR
jgi:hypothetical protein